MYLYHCVPKMMEGTRLYPLSRLEQESPAHYREALAKYTKREHLPDMAVPLLNCKRRDTIFLTAIEPGILRQALAKAGHVHTRQYYEIELTQLDFSATAVMVYRVGDRHCYKPFAEGDAAQYARIPTCTEEYYDKCRIEGYAPFLHHGIPQILYRGSIDIERCKKV
jgi:hypothetical protein